MFRSITLAVVTLIASCGAQQAQAQPFQYIRTWGPNGGTEIRIDKSQGKFTHLTIVYSFPKSPSVFGSTLTLVGQQDMSVQLLANATVVVDTEKFPGKNPIIGFQHPTRYVAAVSWNQFLGPIVETVSQPNILEVFQLSPRPINPFLAPSHWLLMQENSNYWSVDLNITN